MKKVSLLASLVIVLVVLTACAPAETTVLTVGEKEYSQSELEALGTQTVDYTNKDGEVTTYSGVPISAVLEDAGVADTGANITFTAADDYKAEASVEEVMACADCIVAFDDGSLRVVMPDFSSKLQVKDLVSITVR